MHIPLPTPCPLSDAEAHTREAAHARGARPCRPSMREAHGHVVRACERRTAPCVRASSSVKDVLYEVTACAAGRHSTSPQGIGLCDEGVVVVVVGGVDAAAVSIRRQTRSVHRHVVRPLLALHHHRVAELYAVELRIGRGIVCEKSGRGGVARSRPNGKSPASGDGEAHAWLGPEREPERARACDVCEAGRRAGWGVDGTYS